MADTSYTLQIKGLDDVISDFTKAGVNFMPVLQQAMHKATTQIKNTMKDNIAKNGTTFQGNLARSIYIKEETGKRGVVAVGEKYGGAVEFGRSAGKRPPVAPIERWAQLKLGAPGAGFAIAMKIGREGTKAQPFVEPAFRSESPFVLRVFKDGIDIIVGMMAGK